MPKKIFLNQCVGNSMKHPTLNQYLNVFLIGSIKFLFLFLDVPREPVCLRRIHPIPESGGNSSFPSQRGTSNSPFGPPGSVIDGITWPFDSILAAISTIIQETGDRCHSCNKTALSQATTPPAALDTPSTPFESVFADFCDYGGCHYLVVGDRMSGWVDIYKTSPGTSYSGSTGLVACLRQMFATFGVPEILSSDEGPAFTPSETSNSIYMLRRRHVSYMC